MISVTGSCGYSRLEVDIFVAAAFPMIRRIGSSQYIAAWVLEIQQKRDSRVEGRSALTESQGIRTQRQMSNCIAGT